MSKIDKILSKFDKILSFFAKKVAADQKIFFDLEKRLQESATQFEELLATKN